MAKVIGNNVILGGKEYKAGTKESDIAADVKKQAQPFLIDEKKYKAAGQPEAIIDTKVQEHITGLETQIGDERQRAEKAESSLSQANSDIAGLTSQLEEAQTLLDEMTKEVTGLKKAAKK